jgi:hypothetical protein
MKRLLIFDLNGVLLLRNRINKNPDFVLGNFYCYKRHGIDEFLDWVHEHYDVAVWTSAMPHNTLPIVSEIWGDRISKLKFIFTQLECTYDNLKTKSKPLFYKELSIVWRVFPNYDWTNTLLIDDSQDKVILNPPFTSIHPKTMTMDDRGIDHELWNYLKKLNDSDEDIPDFVSKNNFT